MDIRTRCVTSVTNNRYFKIGLVSSKIADDGTSKNMPGAVRCLSPLSHFLAPERLLLTGNSVQI